MKVVLTDQEARLKLQLSFSVLLGSSVKLEGIKKKINTQSKSLTRNKN